MRFSRGVVYSVAGGLVLVCSCTSAQTRRDAYVKEHPALSFPAKDAVVNGEIIRGMTAEDVRASWGEPETVAAGKDAAGTGERWTYFRRLGDYSSVREVIFTGGKVTDVRDSRFSGQYLPGLSGNVGIVISE